MDKEQVIIGGVDVSKCRYFCRYDDLCRNDNIGRVVRPLCKRIPDSYYKQHARKTQEYNTCHTELVSVSNQLKKKTQECEELKRKVELMMDCADCKVDKYKQALDEIEKELKEDIYCENQECGCDDFEECLKCTKEHILNIINKAKGEE